MREDTACSVGAHFSHTSRTHIHYRGGRSNTKVRPGEKLGQKTDTRRVEWPPTGRASVQVMSRTVGKETLVLLSRPRAHNHQPYPPGVVAGLDFFSAGVADHTDSSSLSMGCTKAGEARDVNTCAFSGGQFEVSNQILLD